MLLSEGSGSNPDKTLPKIEQIKTILQSFPRNDGKCDRAALVLIFEWECFSPTCSNRFFPTPSLFLMFAAHDNNVPRATTTTPASTTESGLPTLPLCKSSAMLVAPARNFLLFRLTCSSPTHAPLRNPLALSLDSRLLYRYQNAGCHQRESGSWKNSSWILGNSSCLVDVERTNDYWQRVFQSGFADPKNQALHRRVTDYLRTKPGLVPLNLATRGTRAPYQALILSQKCLAMIHKTRAEPN